VSTEHERCWPATDELFMREYIREWKRLMKAQPRIDIQREP